MSEDTRTAGTISTIRRHRRSIGLSYRRLTLIVLIAIGASLCQAATLVTIVRLATALTAGSSEIDGAVGPISIENVSRGGLMIIGVLLTATVLILEVLLSWQISGLQAGSLRTTQTLFLRTFSEASLDAQLKQTRGDMHQLFFSHTSQIATTVGALGRGAAALTSFVVLVGSSLVLSPIAALIVVIGLVVVLAAIRPIVVLSRRTNQERATNQRRLGSEFAERLELVQEVSAFGIEEQVDGQILSRVEGVARLVRRRVALNGMGTAVYRAGALLIVLGALRVIDILGLDNVTALTGALLILLRSMSYGQAAQKTFQTLSDSVPVFEQLAAEQHRLATAGKSDSAREVTPQAMGDITFDEVTYEYNEAQPAVRDASFRIQSGTLTAVVGRSGAGKSTAMQLMMGERFSTSGTVRFGDSDVSTISDEWLRRHVAYVPQEPRLHSGSVRETIRFFREDISDADIESAARRAHIGHEILSWPQGFETEVGQLGDQLSGGQRQRLAIARAIAGDPDLLLLDEPASALDLESAKAIADALDDLRGSTTIVVIAHRPETVERADQIIAFQDGRATAYTDPSAFSFDAYFNSND